MGIDDVARLATELEGVHRGESEGRAQWRYQGRLVARELDPEHLAIRADFAYRDVIVHQFPSTFSVPVRFAKHMMVAADPHQGSSGRH
jgi:hypothetical protein